MSLRPWFPLYVADWTLGTAALSLAEKGAYLTLLIYQWDHGSLPADHAHLARILGVGLREFQRLWPALEVKFTSDEPQTGVDQPRLWNARMRLERDRASGITVARRANGRKGGLAKARALLEQKATHIQSQSQLPSLTEKARVKPGVNGRKKPSTREPNTPQAKLVEWFGGCFAFHREGEAYVPGKQDFIHAAWLMSNQTREEIKVRADRMLQKTTPFWLENSSLALLRSKWNGLSAAGE